MRGRCGFPAAMLFVCPCSTPDVSSPLCRWSPSTARPPLCVVNHLCVSGSPWALIAIPQCLWSPWLSRRSATLQSQQKPPFFHFFSLIWAEILLPLLKHSQQTPHPPPQSPYHSCASCYTLPSLCCCRLSSLFSLLSTQSTCSHAGSSPYAVLFLLRRVEPASAMPHSLRRSSRMADTHLSTQQIQCKETPSWSDVPCLMDRQHETKTEREEKEGRTEACQMTENDGWVKGIEMWWWEQPLGREFHAVVSVNEGGWGRGRGESNRNAASKSRPRLSTPAERWGMLAKYTTSRLMTRVLVHIYLQPACFFHAFLLFVMNNSDISSVALVSFVNDHDGNGGAGAGRNSFIARKAQESLKLVFIMYLNVICLLFFCFVVW